MSTLQSFRDAIARVTAATPGSHVGCALYLDYNPLQGGHFYAMYYGGERQARHTLACCCTSEERLAAHWSGFVANHQGRAQA